MEKFANALKENTHNTRIKKFLILIGFDIHENTGLRLYLSFWLFQTILMPLIFC
jgi:hypothetical protein